MSWRGGGKVPSRLSETEAERTAATSLSAQISNGVVKVLAEYTGRGPTRARTHISEEVITVVLRDTLTKGERSLVASQKRELVLAARSGYQEAMGPELIKLVEKCTGRVVSAFLSANHLDPDVAVETFVLEPRGSFKATLDDSGSDGTQPDGAQPDGHDAP